MTNGEQPAETAPPEQQGLAESVVKRATSDGGIWDQTWVWIELNWLNLMAGVPAIVATIFLVEMTKGWVKLLVAHKLGDKYTDAIENLIVRTWTVPCAAVWCAILNFTGSWNEMTGLELEWWQGMLLGTVMTSNIALGLVWAIDYYDIAATSRVKFRKSKFGVSKKELKAAGTTTMLGITQEDLAAALEEKKQAEEDE